MTSFAVEIGHEKSDCAVRFAAKVGFYLNVEAEGGQFPSFGVSGVQREPNTS